MQRVSRVGSDERAGRLHLAASIERNLATSSAPVTNRRGRRTARRASPRPPRVLVVERDHRLATMLYTVLSESGMATDMAYDGEQGMAAALAEPYDVIVLDQSLSVLGGRHVARQLRDRRVHTPILLLTDSDAAAVVEGVDDHLVKPFSLRELMARLGALSGRQGIDRQKALEAGEIHVDPVARIVRVRDRKVDLTSREFAILEYLVRNRDRLLTRTAIVRHVWDYGFEGSRTIVEVHMGNLRRKLAAAGAADPIATVRGAGYRFEA